MPIKSKWLSIRFPICRPYLEQLRTLAIDCSSVYPVNRHYDMRLLSLGDNDQQTDRQIPTRAKHELTALGLGRCKHTTCDRDDPALEQVRCRPQAQHGRRLSFCSIRCALRYERRRQRLHREHVAQAAAALIRYCHVCDTRIPANATTPAPQCTFSCSDACSSELRVMSKRAASTRHKRRLSRRRAADRAAALVDTARVQPPAPVAIPAERRVQWPHVSHVQPALYPFEHQKHLVKLAKRRQRERQAAA